MKACGWRISARWSIERTRRDHGLRVDGEQLSAVSQQIVGGLLPQVREITDPAELRGLEGVGASAYFKVFDQMILGDEETFFFYGRNRRPPLDAAQCRLLQAKLCKIMDQEKDSLRFCYLGNRYENKIEHFGAKQTYEPEGLLMV